MKQLKDALEIFLKYNPNAEYGSHYDDDYKELHTIGIDISMVEYEDARTLIDLGWKWDPFAKSWSHIY